MYENICTAIKWSRSVMNIFMDVELHFAEVKSMTLTKATQNLPFDPFPCR